MNSLRITRNLSGYTVLLLFAVVASGTHAQAKDEEKPLVSDSSLTAEQLAVYRAFLKDYLTDDLGTLNLSIETAPVETDGPFGIHDCSNGMVMELPPQKVVHAFRNDDLAHLGFQSLHLVKPDQQSKRVKENDPGKAIRKGIPVDEAVKNGFSNALFTLSEVWLDKTHQHAIVSYRFWCGSLCGNGSSVLLVRKGDTWSVHAHCGGWIS